MTARMPVNDYDEGYAFGTHLAVSNLGHHDEMRAIIAEWWNEQARPGMCEFAAGVVDSLSDWLRIHDSCPRAGVDPDELVVRRR